METQPQEGNGKITIDWKWRDEEGQLDLSNPTDLEKAKRLVNQGYGYEKGQQELKAVKDEKEKYEQQVEYWNGLIEDAKDSGDPTKVAAALEMAGVKMSKSIDDDDIMDAGEKRFKDLEAKYEKVEAALYSQFSNNAHAQLEAKYSSGNYPKYNQKEVEDYANKKGIRDFEDAYRLMNYDEIIKADAKVNVDKGKNHSDKIRLVAEKNHGTGIIPDKPIEKHTDYGKASAGWINDPGIAENLFVDES